MERQQNYFGQHVPRFKNTKLLSQRHIFLVLSSTNLPMSVYWLVTLGFEFALALALG